MPQARDKGTDADAGNCWKISNMSELQMENKIKVY